MADYTGTAAAPPGDLISNDYSGSYEEWLERTARAMAERYAMGDQAMIDALVSPTAGIGQPSGADFGTGVNGGTATISSQTYDFFKHLLSSYGPQEPWVISNFGPPPGRRATYEPNPDSASARDAAGDAAAQKARDDAAAEAQRARDWETGENQKDREFDAGQREADRAVTREGFANDWRIAVQDDATRRYIAEGDWGTQKLVTEMQESGAMDRLQAELGMRDRELAQTAQAEANRHHESMLDFVFRLAEYDQELATQPRNWLKYAAWLENRGIAVNGLSLAMASDLIPDEAIGPDEIGGADMIAASMTANDQAQRLAMVNGQSGGGVAPMPSPQAVPAANQGQPGAGGTMGANLNSTDYAGFAKQLMPGGPVPKSQLQATIDSLQRTAGAQQPSYGGGGMTNGQGLTVQGSGAKYDFRKFAKMPDTGQQMLAGALETVRPLGDWAQEMERNRPKGGVSSGSVASFG